MNGSDAKITKLFCSFTGNKPQEELSLEERASLRRLLEFGTTPENACELVKEGIDEEGSTGSHSIEGFPDVQFTESAQRDLEFYRECQSAQFDLLKALLVGLPGRRPAIGNGFSVAGGNGRGRLLRESSFSVVFRVGDETTSEIVFAIGRIGISPTTKVWRYFDQYKAEDLLKTGCLFFSRLDQLTDDPVETRLPPFDKQAKVQIFKGQFGELAPQTVDDLETILRGTTYVCCWTRREHESYLMWKHYCPSGGGFAIRST